MTTVDIDDAKIDFPSLIEKAAQGESFILAKAGKPLIKLTAIDSPSQIQMKRFGFMKGEIKIPEDFDTACQAEIEEMFFGL